MDALTEIIKKAQEDFKAADDHWNDNREVAKADYRFARLGEQWPDEIERQRNNEGRPVLTINKLPTFVRQVVNDSRQNKPAIRVKPVDSKADPETAQVLNGLIRNIEAISSADGAYDTAVDHAVSMGFGYIRVNIEYSHDDTFDKDLLIGRVMNPMTIYPDPDSTEVDSRDWNKCFVTEVVSKEDFESDYPDAEPINFEGEEESVRQHWNPDGAVMIAEYWVRELVKETVLKLSDGQVIKKADYEQEIDGFTVADMLAAQGIEVVDQRDIQAQKVKQYIVNGQEVLEENEWPGRYIPIVPVYGEELLDNGKRIFRGLIHSAKDAQRMFNYWRSTTTELVALAPKAPWVGKAGSFDGDDRWSTANTESHATLEFEGDFMPQRQPFAGVPAGALQEAMNAADDIKTVTGLHDAALGARSNETSGIAIMARQREGDVSTYHFIDNVSRAIEHLGRIIVDLIPKVYSEARIIRVLGEDGSEENVPINQKYGEPDQPRIHDLGVGKYDVVVKTGPSFTTQREEAATQMIDLIKAFPAAAPVLGDLLAKNLDWPDADEVQKRLQALLPANVQEGNPEAEALKAQLEQAMAEIEQLRTDQRIKIEEVKIKKQANEIDAFEAQTDRMKVTADIQQGMQSAMPMPGSFPGF